jgi:FAD-linked sulfhydryl oxidase
MVGHDCKESICIDAPDVSQLKQTNYFGSVYKQTEMEKIYPERPLYRSEFGRSTWKVLHRISYFFPQKPDDFEKQLISNMFVGLSKFFPCKECADHFKVELKHFPIQLVSNKELAEWVCFQHNLVNKRLNKSIIYNCEDVNKIFNDFKI